MKLDPRKAKDWEIAKEAKKNMKSIEELSKDLGLLEEEVIKMGENIAKIDYLKALKRHKSKKAKYIAVTAITPTPLGEGKTTTCIGLIDGLAKLGKKVTGAIRQPSGGPTFNIKGSAAGGGLSQCIPLKELSLGLTGDIDAITHAHNLSMVALTARMQHERNYDDERLSKIGIKRLDIDENKVFKKWVMDFSAQTLRNITIGQGGMMDGFDMKSGFQIAVSSEIMAILSLARDLKDLRTRISKIVMALNKKGSEITTKDLEVDGAMSAFMVDAINPNLLQTIEGNPVFVHAGPFANIAIGQSSIIADILAMRLSDYHVTESGFGSDIGYEKFWNLKCRYSELKPDAVVIVATIRALKMHGGGPRVRPSKPLDKVYEKEDLDLLRKGCENLIAHIEIVKKSGIKPVVCVNGFYSDTEGEVSLVKEIAEENGAFFAFSEHWLKGGEGAKELAEKVIEACDEKSNFEFLYGLKISIEEKIEKIAKEVYGAEGVDYSSSALERLRVLEGDSEVKKYGICMAKTHLSLSHDPEFKGRPRGWYLPVKDFLVYKGAEFLVPVTGSIKLMPGTCSRPAFRHIDVDVKTGDVTGLF
jgi:formate--tetrahydrofolate ligase